MSGRIGNIPAEEISVKTDLVSDKPSINISGKIRQAKFFGEYLVMERKIKSYLGENKVFISSYVTNEGYYSYPGRSDLKWSEVSRGHISWLTPVKG